MEQPSPARTGGGPLNAPGMPLHRQLFLVLREQISRGALRPEEALPTELALGQQYGVSRITVRRALQDLSDQGYVQRRQGRGTYVLGRTAKEPPPSLTVLDGLRKAELETSVELIEYGPRNPPPAAQAALGLKPPADALYALRLRRDKTTAEPLMITETWLPSRFADALTWRALETTALYKLLAQQGVVTGRVIQEVTAEIADPFKAQLLETDIGGALLRINRLVFDTDQHPVEYLSLYLSPTKSRILMNISADQIDSAESGLVAHDVSHGPAN